MRIGVLASGGGSNLQALIDHFTRPGTTDSRIVWVGSNGSAAPALARATAAGIATGVIDNPADEATQLAQFRDAGVELLVLAGYLKLIPAAVVGAYRGRLLNVHPSLLPSFGGAGMFGEHVHAAVLTAGATVTGVTVHFVDEAFDRGAIIAQWPVPVVPGDTARTLAARVLRAEHRLYPVCVAAVAAGAVVLGADGRTHGRALGDVGAPATPSSLYWRFTLVDGPHTTLSIPDATRPAFRL